MFQNQLHLGPSQTQTVKHRFLVIQAMPLLRSLLEAQDAISRYASVVHAVLQNESSCLTASVSHKSMGISKKVRLIFSGSRTGGISLTLTHTDSIENFI